MYAEDDETLSFITKDHLELQGYDVHHSVNGADAFEAYKKTNLTFAYLTSCCQRWMASPLLKTLEGGTNRFQYFLTAKSLKEDRIHGLKLGGDDYLTKPFSIEELILKIEIFLRRSRVFEAPSQEQEIIIGNYRYLPLEYQLIKESNVRVLTQRESELLDFWLNIKTKSLKDQSFSKTFGVKMIILWVEVWMSSFQDLENT